MPGTHKAVFSTILAVVLVSVLGHSAFADSAQFLFADSFAEDQFGDPLAGWRVDAGDGYVCVVPDAELDTGRAVRITSDPNLENTSISAPLWDPPAEQAKTIVIEHRIRSSQEKNNMYISKARSHRLHWWVAADHLYFNRGVGTKQSALRLGKLQEGWNRIRLVADIERQEVVFYLNDMQVPISEPLTFGRPVDSWAGAELILAQHRNIKGEFFYGDVKVWTLGPNSEEESRQRAEQAATPIWIEYNDVAQRPPEWWETDEARFLAERIVRRMESDEITIDILIGTLTVPDGILATQLSVLAHMYAITGEVKYREAFRKGLNTLLEAQFPSGGWPTVYPRYKNRDLHDDFFAKSTWTAIPVLLQAVLEQEPPFHTGIVASIDLAAVEEALGRIPPKEHTKRFMYSDYAGQSPAWWTTEEAKRIGDNLLSWQTSTGGWGWVMGMAHFPFSPEYPTRTPSCRDGIERADFNRGRTIAPIRFLGRLYAATGERRFLEAFYRSLDFILASQYPSGGWPHVYPDPESYTSYSRHVTFYTDAMASVMSLIQDVVLERHPFEFVDDAYRARLAQAFDRGIDYIVKAQIEVDGRLTGWGHRHDPDTYKPQASRSFEPVATAISSSTGILRLLHSIPDPSVEVKRAVLSGFEWLEKVRLEDGRWALFYEIGTDRAIFAGRDGIVRYDFSEIELERQLNYSWYGTWPEELLKQAHRSGYYDALYESLPDYPAVRVRFLSLENGSRVTGTLPLNIELLHAHHAEDLVSVTIDVDGENIYRGARLPGPDELLIDTERLDDGHRLLTVTTVHDTYGAFRQTLDINVANRWTLVQNMAPPVTEGWFPIDFLQTASRSEGWVYDTSDSDRFFRDPHRLLRGTDTAEHLVWETPRLQTVTLTLFVRPEIRLEEGLELAVAVSPEAWKPIAYTAKLDGDADDWQRAMITLDLSEATDQHWFRLTLSDALPKEAVQIGGVVFTGFELASITK